MLEGVSNIFPSANLPSWRCSKNLLQPQLLQERELETFWVIFFLYITHGNKLLCKKVKETENQDSASSGDQCRNMHFNPNSMDRLVLRQAWRAVIMFLWRKRHFLNPGQNYLQFNAEFMSLVDWKASEMF